MLVTPRAPTGNLKNIALLAELMILNAMCAFESWWLNFPAKKNL